MTLITVLLLLIRVMSTTSGELVMALYATVTVVFIMIIAALMYKWCTRRKVSHDPASKCLKTCVSVKLLVLL